MAPPDRSTAPSRSPHPATVAQRRAPAAQKIRPPHAATVAQPRAATPQKIRPPHPATIQRRAAPSTLQKSRASAKELYYTADRKEFKNEVALISGNVISLTDATYAKGVAAMPAGSIVHVQQHGQYNANNEATNKIIYGKAMVATDFAKQSVITLLPKDRVFTLDLVSCFTAGSREQWDAKYHPGHIAETFAHQLATQMLADGFAVGTVVRGYIGQSKLLSGGFGGFRVGAGANCGVTDPSKSEEGWYVDFTLGKPITVTSPKM
jgi:hypothetical protein